MILPSDKYSLLLLADWLEEFGSSYDIVKANAIRNFKYTLGYKDKHIFSGKGNGFALGYGYGFGYGDGKNGDDQKSENGNGKGNGIDFYRNGHSFGWGAWKLYTMIFPSDKYSLLLLADWLEEYGTSYDIVKSTAIRNNNYDLNFENNKNDFMVCINSKSFLLVFSGHGFGVGNGHGSGYGNKLGIGCGYGDGFGYGTIFGDGDGIGATIQ